MAIKRMLVDGTHPEETRIVVTNGNRLEEFDFESQSRRQLRGNIYLAKVTRVEPSLQAAFIEYGGNRHGFLAFSEIHPDYYQIPVADREALLREEEEEDHEGAEDDPSEQHAHASTDADADADPQSLHDDDDDASHIEQAPVNSEPIESIGGGSDLLEESRERRQRQPRRHQYKIQEVIKRRQVMLVQVVKEERGNKGAALTTYLSLAGRYSVLMPNTARGGGISRKITNAADRKRLKDIVGDLEVPQGQGIILRTAGASRTKAEVKRDFEYLQRLWESVRTLTLKSTAPCLVYEEGSLIKRTIRDLYSKDIDELWVAGDDAYREAKDFMKMIMPSHAKNVQVYRDDQPLFSKYNVEGQLDQMFLPQVTLPSGGYLVINPTEALVSIDVNSGRSTKEHNIEDTALQTNLEAADEVARQLRLRDLAGLIVIDFIDMSENRANRAVERRLKDALKNDRARIQVGRISHFGLMEMSRQRIRFGVVESSTHKCPTCNGTGLVRSVESVALMVMRNVEDHVLKKPGQSINVRVPVEVALYILNSKRNTLTTLEVKYGLSINLVADEHVGAAHYVIERGEARLNTGDLPPPSQHVRVDSATIVEEEEADEPVVEEEEEAEVAAEAPEGHADERDERGGRRRRRRRGGRDRDHRDAHPQPAAAEAVTPVEAVTAVEAVTTGDEDEEAEGAADGHEHEIAADGSDEPRRRRRRGRRGGRRNRRPEDDNGGVIHEAEAEAAPEAAPVVAGEAASDVAAEAVLAQDAIAASADIEPAAEVTAAPAEAVATDVTAATEATEAVVAEKPKRVRRPRKAATAAEAAPAEVAPEAVAAPVETPAEEPKAKPKPRARKPKAAATEAQPVAAVEAVATPEPAPAAAPVAAAAAAPVTAPETAPTAEPAADETPRRAKKALPPDEIVVSSSTAEGEETKPKKGGWWQRNFFGS